MYDVVTDVNTLDYYDLETCSVADLENQPPINPRANFLSARGSGQRLFNNASNIDLNDLV